MLAKAENGDSGAQHLVAGYYEDGIHKEDGIIVFSDLERSFYWTKRAYESGNIDSTVRYADYLCDDGNEFCEKDVDMAIRLYMRAIEGGSLLACLNLGMEYTEAQDFENAFKYYSMAGGIGYFKTGLCCYYGLGTPRDKRKALGLFELVTQGDESKYNIGEACFIMGEIYLEGSIVEQSFERARHYLLLADTFGDHRSAQSVLAAIGWD